MAGAYAARGAGIGYIVIIDPEDSGLIWVGEQVDCVIQEHEQLYEMLCQRMQRIRTQKSAAEMVSARRNVHQIREGM